ncbi:acyl-CoA dehydrogenase family protein [Ottowia thiooxydans]|uniref:Alkylation response protein AidB-like acyl-CoA dehydrogenase n=1 Tax=Ottowia thiooxydans TaxID=219182 RepID=A0ABV2QBL3_9BURK
MDFDFSDDQQALRDAVAKWVEKSYDFEQRRKIVEAGGFDRKVYNELAELGLAGIYISEEHGGLGMGPVEAMVAMEELGRGIVCEPLAQAFMAGALIQDQAPSALKEHWLPRIASGEALVVLAHQERKARYRLDVCETQATKNGSAYEVTGLKNIVPAGDQADAFLVPALLDGTLAIFLVERSAQGVSTRGYATQDEARAADLKLDKAPAQLITASGLDALTRTVDIGIASVCAEGVGAMEKTLALTVDYMNQRKQFGVTIASFQALRHRVADMKMQLELARSMSYYASLKLGEPAAERRQALSRAKVQLGQSLRYVSQQSVQLHGGIGVTDEYVGSHYFKKLTQLEMTYGDTMHHLGEVSARMGETAGVFA